MKLQRPEEFGCPVGISGNAWRANGLAVAKYIGQDGYVELEMDKIGSVGSTEFAYDRIGPAVVELHCQQEFGKPKGKLWRAQQANYRCTSTSKYGSIELQTERSGLVVVE